MYLVDNITNKMMISSYEVTHPLHYKDVVILKKDEISYKDLKRIFLDKYACEWYELEVPEKIRIPYSIQANICTRLTDDELKLIPWVIGFDGEEFKKEENK